jgi:replication-associated recombination protein RarA
MQDFCNDPEIPLTMQQMGLLLYGPPGTGKTKLCQKLAMVCGLTQVVEPLASTGSYRKKRKKMLRER